MRCPRSKRLFADWHARTALGWLAPHPRAALSSQRFGDAMDALTDDTIRAAEEQIVRSAIDRYRLQLRPVVYDTTNFQTFVDSGNQRNTIARRGHAKGGRHDLRLVGLALCVALDGNVPLAHELYHGNRNDATEFPQALALIAQRVGALRPTDEQLAELTLVYDKGNNSKANQALADELGVAVVGSLATAHHPELLAILANQFRALEGIEAATAYRTQIEVYGTTRTVIVSRSERFAQKQARSFAQTLTNARRELQQRLYHALDLAQPAPTT